MNERDKELAEQAGNYVNKVYTPPVRSKTPGKIWQAAGDQARALAAQFNAKYADLIRADEREACAQFLERIDLGNLPPDLALYYASLINSLVNGIRGRGNT